MLEIMVVVLFAASRVDQRFYIPKTLKEDGSGHRMVEEETEGEAEAEIVVEK